MPVGIGSRRFTSTFTSSANAPYPVIAITWVAGLPARDAVADGLDDARQLASRGKRQRRLQLVLVLDDQHVREVDARRFDRDDDFARTSHRRRNVLDDERVGGTVRFAENRFHGGECITRSDATGHHEVTKRREGHEEYLY
jgi:hypothetical protein